MNHRKTYYKLIPLITLPKEKGSTLDLEAICYFLSTGFFLEDDTFWKGIKWKGRSKHDLAWRYEPNDYSLDQTVEAFASLFETIVEDQVAGNNVILSLSGGLDSRTLAVALQRLDIQPSITYSYQFAGGVHENIFGKTIAKSMQWPFQAYEIPEGYLWDSLEWAGKTNRCYAEFAHARQVAVAKEVSKYGDLWLLGHGGDLFFDNMGIGEEVKFDDQVKIAKKLIVKKGGEQLGSQLWSYLNLDGSFVDTFQDRLEKMCSKIDIRNVNAKLRAFKSRYYVPRWTNTNLVFFSNFCSMALPYFDDRMCQFIMTVPEKWLAGRQIQIEYIKRYGGELAKIPWQAKAPYNLYNYHKHRSIHHLPYRVKNKLYRIWKEKVEGKPLVTRNWEIQFCGEENDKHLRRWLFEQPSFKELIPEKIVGQFYSNFKNKDAVRYAHPVSMLLTLSVFSKLNEEGKL